MQSIKILFDTWTQNYGWLHMAIGALSGFFVTYWIVPFSSQKAQNSANLYDQDRLTEAEVKKQGRLLLQQQRFSLYQEFFQLLDEFNKQNTIQFAQKMNGLFLKYSLGLSYGSADEEENDENEHQRSLQLTMQDFTSGMIGLIEQVHTESLRVNTEQERLKTMASTQVLELFNLYHQKVDAATEVIEEYRKLLDPMMPIDQLSEQMAAYMPKLIEPSEAVSHARYQLQIQIRKELGAEDY